MVDWLLLQEMCVGAHQTRKAADLAVAELKNEQIETDETDQIIVEEVQSEDI
jgi:hypothetical protein